MKHVQFFYKVQRIDNIKPRDEEEIRRIVEPLIPKERRASVDLSFLVNLLSTDESYSNYKIHAFVPLNTREYDKFANNLLSDSEMLEKHKDLMFADAKKVNCICIYNNRRPYALLVNSEGFKYARYVAKVPREEVVDE